MVVFLKLLNVVSGDCSRMYELVVSGQVSIGGPLVMLMCSVYIWYELGWLPLIGLSVFAISYPLQVNTKLLLFSIHNYNRDTF